VTPEPAIRALSRRWAIALAAVAVLAVAGQALVQWQLHQGAADAETINRAGRQRMLSQRLTKAALIWRHGADDSARATAATEAALVLAEWRTAHARLRADAPPPAAAAALAAIDPAFAAMTAAASDLAAPGAVDRLLAEEPRFLAGMECAVAAYDHAATARVRRLARIELMLLGLTLAVLACEAVLVFAPAVRRLRQAMAEREALRARALETALATERDRLAQRIGQDLHDTLGQRLTALSLQARALAAGATGGDSAQRERAQSIAAEAATAVREARALAHALAPLAVAQGRLGDALGELAARSGVACTCHADPAAEPPGAAAANDLWLIAQEAVANAIRHGGATRIALALVREAGGGRLTITDNGRGIDPAAPPGLGLAGMRLRAGRIGGRLDLTAAAASGTIVTCTYPL
jgi:signal transduction histidine kinase